MKKILFYTTILIISAVACTKDPVEEEITPNQIEYLVTRGITPLDAPSNDYTYTIVSYNRNSDNTTYGPNVSTESHYLSALYDQIPVGYYAYYADAKYKGVLQPADIDGDYPHQAFSRDAKKGQGLYDGFFRTYYLHPAVPFTYSEDLRNNRVSFARRNPLYSSEHFDMQVNGYEIFDVDLTVGNSSALTEVRSKVLLEFVQGTGQSFTITDVRLINAGEYGWYHPLLQNTKVSYDLSNEGNIYDRIENQTAGNSVSIPILATYPTTPTGDCLYTTGSSGIGATVYNTYSGTNDGLFFFSNDYQQDALLQPGITFKLSVGGSTAFDVTIPLNLTMLRNYVYRFKLTVESTSINVSFKEIIWNSVPIIDDIGGIESKIYGVWRADGWTYDHSWTGNIGS